MEGIDHIDIVQIRRRRLIGEIDGVLERNIPDGKGFVLGITRLDPPLVVMIKLGEAGRHLPAPRPRGRDHHKGSCGLDILIFAVPVVADNQGDVRRIVFYGIVQIHSDVLFLKPLLKAHGPYLARIMREHHAPHIKPPAAKLIHQPLDVLVIGNSQIPPYLILFDIRRIDHDHDLRPVGELHQHAQLAVRLKTRQNP